MRIQRLLSEIAIWAVVLLPALVAPVSAETLVQSDVNARVMLAFRIAEPEVKRWLPEPWKVNPPSTGANKGANLFLVFTERLLNQDPEGKTIPNGTDRFVGLAIPARNTQTEKTAVFVIRIFASNPDAVPGPYKNSKLAEVARKFSASGANAEPGASEDSWTVRSDSADEISLHLKYQKAVPTRSKAEPHIYSSVEPTFFRVYRVDQGTDVVRSAPLGMDRVAEYRLQVSGPELSKLFDGTEELVGISIQPWYIRQIFLP